MELTTARQLADLNRRFYEDHATAFANARSSPQPGVRRLLARIPPGASVLELGCGDGKVAHALVAHSKIATYLGLDLNPAMLERARRTPTPSPSPVRKSADRGGESLSPPLFASSANGGGPGWGPGWKFALADLTSPGWSRVLPPAPFDWILAFAVFHHLPGSDARAQTLRTLTDHLASGGTFVMSNWQFTRSERLKQRIVPWSAMNLSETVVERGDYLLSWERSGKRGLRYVHLLAEDEARRMAEGAGLAVVEVFRSDGVTGELADYVVMRKLGKSND